MGKSEEVFSSWFSIQNPRARSKANTRWVRFVSDATMHPQGYVYAVCNRGHYASVKIGYTTVPVVEQYLQESYSRSLTPLEIIFAVPVADARLAEKVLHHFLARHRIHRRHELFALDGRLDDLEEAKRTVQALDARSGLPVPSERPVSIAYWKVAKDAAQEGGRRQKQRREEERAEEERENRRSKKLERRQERLAVVAVQEEVRRKARAELRLTDEEMAAKVRAEVQKQRQDRKQKVEQGKEVLEAFVHDNVQTAGRKDFVKVKDLYNAYIGKHDTGQKTRTYPDQKVFKLALDEVLDPAKFRKQYYYYKNDKGTTTSSIYICCKWKT